MKTLYVLAALLSALVLTQCRSDGSDGDGDSDLDGDVDGDADGDADEATDADGDSDDGGDGGGDGGPCLPMAGEACDPVRSCGCEEGLYCDVRQDETGAILAMCVEGETGDGVHGDECAAPTDCAPGHLCGGDPPLCYQWCLADEDCSEPYPGSSCGIAIDGAAYRLCTPEDEAIGVGEAIFSVCTGRLGDCPGNPPFSYEMRYGTTGRCSVTAGEPMSLLFSLYDTLQSLTVTGNDLRFTPEGDGFVTAEQGEASRFSIQVPDGRLFSTRNIASPPEEDDCEVRVRYRPPAGSEEASFDLEFTCNNIDVNATDDRLVTIVDGEMGPGTITMTGCALE